MPIPNTMPEYLTTLLPDISHTVGLKKARHSVHIRAPKSVRYSG
jgi:hypothetical protein